MHSFIGELKRRNVFKVAAAYAITGWIMVEITTTILPTFEAPDWVTKVITYLIILGFPFALIFAWAFEMTPDGLKRSHEVPVEQSITTTTGKKLNGAIISVLVIAILVLVMTGRWSDQQDATSNVAVSAHDSIAVLPFANRSREEDDVYFVDGMHDDILTQLAKIHALKVISRTSVMEYRDTTKNMQEIGEELGASAILEGGVQRAGNTVRINVQLIDAATDEHLWAETYDRELTVNNVFAIQSEMAREIASALRTALTPEEQQRIAAIPTQSLAAYEEYLLGKSKVTLRYVDDLKEAIAHFNRAIEIDQDYALAYVGLANAESWLYNYGNVPLDEYQARAMTAARRAIELDPNLGDAYTALAGVYQQINDIEKVVESLNKAIELNANDSLAYHWLAEATRHYFGDGEKALALHRKAGEVNPRDPVVQVSKCEDLFIQGRFEEARQQALYVVEQWPKYDAGLWHASFPDWTVNARIDLAMPYVERALQMLDDAGNNAGYGWMHFDLGNDEMARKHLDLAEDHGGDYFTFLVTTVFQTVMGNHDAAVAAANKVVEYHLDPGAMRVLRDNDIRNGDIDAALARYSAQSPNAIGDSPVRFQPAGSGKFFLDWAYLYSLKGDRGAEFQWLLNAGEKHIANYPRLGYLGNDLADVQLALLRGDRDQALRALQRAVDESWQFQWRFHLSNPAFDEIRDTTEFQQAVEKIRARVADQKTRLEAKQMAGSIN